MLDWLVITHGSTAGRKAYAPLVDGLCQRLKARIGLATLEDLQAEVPQAQRAMALLLCAGGHIAEAEALAARAQARFCGAPPAELVAQSAVASAQAAFGRRTAVLFLVHDWQHCEALIAALYAHTRIFSYPVIAAWHGKPALARILARWREEEGKPLAVQPVFVAEGAWREGLIAAAQQAGVELAIGKPLAEHETFLASLAGWMQEVG